MSAVAVPATNATSAAPGCNRAVRLTRKAQPASRQALPRQSARTEAARGGRTFGKAAKAGGDWRRIESDKSKQPTDSPTEAAAAVANLRSCRSGGKGCWEGGFGPLTKLGKP